MDIMIVGEAWGEKEEELQQPFVGPSGFILNNMLSQVGIDRKECYVTNVFNLRPQPRNDIINLCGSKTEAIAGYPALTKGKYVKQQYAPELDRLYSEVRTHQPNIIIALGATAAWAFLHTAGIKPIRGFISPSYRTVSERLGREFKILPTYHPAAIGREWSLRPVAIADLDKAKRESQFLECIRPKRLIWIEPTLEDLYEYEQKFILPATKLSADIETWQDQITCIGFAPSADSAIVVPFTTERGSGHSYWPTTSEELIAWDFVRRWLTKSLIFQNGMFDMNVIWSKYGLPCPSAEDTMLAHHAMQPELEKGLGFLGSVYTDEWAWKFMRKGLNHD